jgi:hypothetical protein
MKALNFPRWAEVLAGSELPEKTCTNFKVTIRWYLSWCHSNSVICSVESARAFVDWAQADKGANDWMVNRWKDAIRWFFKSGREQGAMKDSSSGVPIVGSVGRDGHLKERSCDSLNETSAERIEPKTNDETIILEFMRRRGMALRTERSYLSWYRDFLKQSGLRTVKLIQASSQKIVRLRFAYMDD